MTYPELVEHGVVLGAVGDVGLQLVVRPPHSGHLRLRGRPSHQARVVALQKPTKDVRHAPAAVIDLQQPICKKQDRKNLIRMPSYEM